ncbi:MAG: PepSY-associated TM helix domain-containing protein [Saprospiraceae bacterium]
MSSPSRFKGYVQRLRDSRKWHRTLGLALSFFLFISAGTGILLALKKEIPAIQPKTQKGSSKDLSDWKSIAELSDIATEALHSTQLEQYANTVDRIDVRPSKGIVKVLFKEQQWEVQLDASTGKVYSVARRHSDWIEALHDGSIISDWFKLVSMNFLGFGVIVLLGTGIWLWYGPRLLRKLKRRRGR